MFQRFSAAAVAAAVMLIGVGAACAETWTIKLKSSHPGAKVNIYDVVAGKSLGSDKDGANDITVSAEAKKGGGSESDKLGTHIRWSATHNGRCWWGQVCSTRSGVEASLGAFPMDASRAAGNCKIDGERPACGSEN